MFDPIVERLVDDLQIFPGIGERSARRMSLKLFAHRESAKQLVQSMLDAIDKIDKCQQCRNYSSLSICKICNDLQRRQNTLCVVVTSQDLMAIELSNGFQGKYFVLHGLLSPINHFGTEHIDIDCFEQSLTGIDELILALPYTIEGETTSAFLTGLAKKQPINISRLSQGIPSGGDIANLDRLTLNSAFNQRQRY